MRRWVGALMALGIVVGGSSIAVAGLRVVGGAPAAAGAWPSLVAITETGVAPDVGQFCAGTLIAPDAVLTSAACTTHVVPPATTPVDYLPAEIEIHAGLTNLTDPGTTQGLTSITRHPTLDVAILHLATPLTLSSTIAISDLTSPIDTAATAPGSPATIAGWGATDAAGTAFPTALQQAGVHVLDDTVCAATAVFGASFDAPSMTCAGEQAGGVDACTGDEGGPLMVGPANARTIAGVLSVWGGSSTTCAAANQPSAYVSADAIRDWAYADIGGVSAPGAPTNTSVTAGTHSLTVKWTPPASDGGRPVQSYRVTATKPGAGVQPAVSTVVTSATTATLTGLDIYSNSPTYQIQVRAANGAGIGPASSIVGSPASSAPRITAPKVFVGNVGEPLSWTPGVATFDGPAGRINYLIETCDAAMTACRTVGPLFEGQPFVIPATFLGRRWRIAATATNGVFGPPATAQSDPTAQAMPRFEVPKPRVVKLGGNVYQLRLQSIVEPVSVITIQVLVRGRAIRLDTNSSRINGRRSDRINATTLRGTSSGLAVPIRVTLDGRRTGPKQPVLLVITTRHKTSHIVVTKRVGVKVPSVAK